MRKDVKTEVETKNMYCKLKQENEMKIKYWIIL
jgi:hypothetical protein